MASPSHVNSSSKPPDPPSGDTHPPISPSPAESHPLMLVDSPASGFPFLAHGHPSVAVSSLPTAVSSHQAHPSMRQSSLPPASKTHPSQDVPPVGTDVGPLASIAGTASAGSKAVFPSVAAVDVPSSSRVPPAPMAAQVRSYASVLTNQGLRLHSNAPAASDPVTAVAGRPVPRPRFPPLNIPNRQVSTKDGKPSICFTASEIVACEKRYEHSIIAKFTVGRPSLSEIQRTFQANWVLTGRASISDIWDSRHILVILDSEEDVRTVLSSPLNKVGLAYFRLFRWSPDYNPKRESTVTTIWVRLPGLPLSIYDSSFVAAIVSTFGFFVSVDVRTKACSSLKFARACVELDVTKPIPDAVWINMPDNKSYWQSIEVESKLSYCNRCRVHGHSYDQCRKRRKTNQPSPKEVNLQKNVVPTAPGEVGEDGLLEDFSLEKETSVPLAVESCSQTVADVSHDLTKALVIYEEVVADTPSTHVLAETTEFASSVDAGQSSQVGKILESPAPAPSGPCTLGDYLPLIRPYLEEEGIFDIPDDIDDIDDSLMDIMSRSVRKYRSSLHIPAASPVDYSPPISEWATIKSKRKKKGKKVAYNESNSALRRSSRSRQLTEVKNSEFVYRSLR